MNEALAQTGIADPLLDAGGNVLLSQGVLGVVVIGLVYFVMLLRKELRETREANKIEIAAKDALIIQLYNDRITEMRVGLDLARSNNRTLDALAVAAHTQKVPQ